MRKAKHLGAALVLVGVGLVAANWIACSSDNPVTEPSPDAGGAPDTGTGPQPGDGGADGAPSDCFQNPTTYYEIINACTDAVKITKNPTLPLLLADGGLPPTM